MISLLRSLSHSFYVLLFRPERFKVKLSVSRNLDFIIYECPGVWASDQEIEELTRNLRMVALAGQDGKELPEYGVLLGDREDLKTRVISIAFDKKLNRAVGFSAQAYLDIEKYSFKERVLHLGLIYVDPSYQGKSVSYLLAMFPNLVLMIKNGFRDSFVTNVTQVPAVAGLVAYNYYNVYPVAKKEVKQSFYHRKIAKWVYEDHKKAFGVGEDSGFDVNRQVITNAYTGGSDHLKKSFSDAPKHRDPEINALCERELDYQRGDDLIQVGQLSPRVFVELFKNKKSKQSRVQMLFNLAAFSLAAILLPVVRWFVPGGTKSPSKKELPHIL